MILVITRDGDTHAPHVINLLRMACQDVVEVMYSDFPCKTEISYIPNVDDTKICISGRTINLNSITSVYNRRHDDPKANESIKDPKIREYIKDESQIMVESLAELTSAFWLSKPDQIRIANRKTYQLKLARALGFNIPQSLISNSPSEAKSFLKNHDFAVIKALYNSGITTGVGDHPQRTAFYTRKVAKQEILAQIDRIKNCPVILQAYIEKAFELRITVVGSRIFPCAIYSQECERTTEDWRRYDLPNTPHREFKLPEVIEQKCFELIRKLKLNFGCIDMIITPKGEYVFLEINPNGQWRWIETMTGMKIGQSIAELLIEPGKLKIY